MIGKLFLLKGVTPHHIPQIAGNLHPKGPALYKSLMMPKALNIV